MNLTNLHNQSACTSQFGLCSKKSESKSKKGTRTDYTLHLAHKSRNGAGKNGSKVVKDQWKSALNATSSVVIKKGTKHTAKTIQGLTFANDKKKALLLRRLGKLHAATRGVKA
jgi:hypothetical protein